MGHRFENEDRIELDVSPERIWEAIATGPGVTSWFIGRTEIEAGEGGVVRTVFNDFAPESTITAWEPGRHLAYGTEREEDGRFVACEFLIEGRDSGSTVKDFDIRLY